MKSISQKIFEILAEWRHAEGQLKHAIDLILASGDGDGSARFVVHSATHANLVTPGANLHEAAPFPPPSEPMVLPCHGARLAVFMDGAVHVVRDIHEHFPYRASAVRIFSAERGEPRSAQVVAAKTDHSAPITTDGIALSRPPKPPTPLAEDAEVGPIATAVKTLSQAFAGYSGSIEAKRQRLDTLTARRAKLAELVPAVEKKITKLEAMAAAVEHRAEKAGSGIRLLTDRVGELQRLRGAVTAQEQALVNTQAELAEVEQAIADLTATTIPIPEALAKLAS